MIAAVILLALAAQDPAARVGSAPAPTVGCTAPDLPDRARLSPEDADRIQDEARAYADCMTAEIEVRRQAVDVRVAEVQKESDAVNALASEANAFVVRFNGWQATPLAQRSAHQP